ncbi:MAG: PilC/PilY family type IV pilus protein [Acidovorax sp.]
MAFDPTLTYAPPIKADGTSYANASFSSAWTDGFAQTGSTNLGNTSTVTLSATNPVTPGTGSKTFNFTSSSIDSATFAVGQTVTLTSKSTTVSYTGTRSPYTVTTTTVTNTMSGTVTAWSGSGNNWTLDVNVTASTSSTPNAVTSSSNSKPTIGTTSEAWSVTQTYGTAYYYTYNGAQPAMGWTYQTSGSNIGDVDTTTTFYQECASTIGDSTSKGYGVFAKQLIRNQTATVQQNYANWYSYYRKRTFLMRTAVGKAISTLGDGYRVGFSTINSSSGTPAVTSSGFQPLDTFTGTQPGTQRATVYSKLYGATANGGTPLRGALSTMGRYYAGNFITTSVPDPIQYACQRNYTLLTTDGYWNESTRSSYGPRDVSGNLVGNQDGTEVKPMYDGTISTTTYSRTQYTVASSKYKNSSRGTCSGAWSSGTVYYQVTTQLQTSTDGSTWTNSGSPTNTCPAGSSTVYGSQTAASLAGQSIYSATTSTTNVSGGSSNTLADVAEYYYKTDLRPATGVCTSTSSGTSQNVCSDIVPTSGRDTATWQHMTTFTVGLGVSGTLAYDPNYLTQTSGSYVNLKNGTASWPVPSDSGNGDARQVDDLWHAAVDGRGQYYSALNATLLASAIQGVVNTIQAVTGSSSAATTSTLELVAGENNQIYSASYTTALWVGDLKAYTLNGNTGAIGTTPIWSAQDKLTAMPLASRNIYYRRTGGALGAFNWANLNSDGYGGYFSGLCSTKTGVSQCSNALNATEQTVASDGARLVNYLSGDRTYESANTSANTSQAVYRVRDKGLLGDIINGAPRYVGVPNFSYSDTGYANFVTAQKNRKPVVYVAANDGMLHAISADTSDGGTELWAYVPAAVMPNMYMLADADYANKHRYFVDGAPVVGDAYINGAWKTILVGGLGKGGRSYYALDITDPQNPVSLWEFSNDNLGLTFGNPVITKRQDGTWVVAFASGYNNTSPGDGKGHLFVVNAATGALVAGGDVATAAGSTSSPSGLAKISGWIDLAADNTSKRFYGGDLLGNLWRFDIDGLVEPKNAALLLAQFQINSTTPQPITTRPRLTTVAKLPVIMVGTGEYLNTADITDTTTQSVYAVKDSLTSTGLGDVRKNTTMVKQTLTLSTDKASATITNNPVNWSAQNGWWVDLPQAGERVAIDMVLVSGMLSVATAIPKGDACTSGGSSWTYYLNAANGNALGNTAGSKSSDNALIVGQNAVALATSTTGGSGVDTGGGSGGGDGNSNGSGVGIVQQNSDGSTVIKKPGVGSSSNLTPQRTSWRELVN